MKSKCVLYLNLTRTFDIGHFSLEIEFLILTPSPDPGVSTKPDSFVPRDDDRLTYS